MHIYFSGIGGAGLSPLAQLSLDCGFEVSGSDAVASLLTEVLEKRGIEVTIGQSYEEIAAVHNRNPIDWIVVSSALKLDHPHYKFAQDHGIKISKRHDLINLILEEKNLKLIAVAGTHGKTTTTAMIVWLFKQLNIPVSYSIGSNISFGPSAEYQEGSEYFVYEADEFDRNFLNFKPYISLITALDYDHPDTYATQDDYFEAFQDFCLSSQNVIATDSNLTKMGFKYDHKKYNYFLSLEKSHATNNTPKIVNPLDNSGIFIKNEDILLAGSHNRSNAALAITVLDQILNLNDSFENGQTLLNSIKTFPGTQRRFEKLAENLYTDYAHHPTEIAATLELATEVKNEKFKVQSGEKILRFAQNDRGLQNDNNNSELSTQHSALIAVYQPHQNIRQHEKLVQEGYEHCFDLADKIYWLPTYLSRENPDLEVLSSKFLASLVSKEKSVETAQLDDELAQKIKKHLENGDMVIATGAGSVDEWARNISL